MRACIVICALILYLVSFNLYLFNIHNTEILREHKLLWYTYMTGGVLLFYTIDGWRGYVNLWHDMASRLLMITVLTNFGLIALVHHGILVDPINQMVAFNLTWLIINTMVLISCAKNGVFEK